MGIFYARIGCQATENQGFRTAWGGVSLELLVLWRVRVIEGPLLQRYVSADEGKKPAVLLVKSFDN